MKQFDALSKKMDGRSLTIHTKLNLKVWRLMADLGAERIFAAERGGNKIVVEIKVLGGESQTSEFEKALGQYDLYEMYLEEIEPERKVFLAVSAEVYERFFQLPAIDFAVKKKKLRLLVFNHKTEEIVRWIS